MGRRSKCSAYIEEAVNKFHEKRMVEVRKLIEENAKLDAELAKYQEIARKKTIEKNTKSDND